MIIFTTQYASTPHFNMPLSSQPPIYKVNTRRLPANCILLDGASISGKSQILLHLQPSPKFPKHIPLLLFVIQWLIVPPTLGNINLKVCLQVLNTNRASILTNLKISNFPNPNPNHMFIWFHLINFQAQCKSTATGLQYSNNIKATLSPFQGQPKTPKTSNSSKLAGIAWRVFITVRQFMPKT